MPLQIRIVLVIFQVVADEPIAHQRRRLSDAELLSARFKYTDPENTIPNLNRRVPDPERDPVIIGYYDERPKGGRAENPDFPFVWCCHCQKPTHWDGRVIQDTSGSVYIIGNTCGRDHYGDRFISIERAFREEQTRIGLLPRWARLASLSEGAAAEVGMLLTDNELRKIELKRAEMNQAAPRIFSRLSAIARSGAALEVHEQVRDLAAERRRLHRYHEAMAEFRALPSSERRWRERNDEAPKLDTSPIFRTERVRIGPLAGKPMLAPAFDLRGTAFNLQPVLQKVVSLAGGRTDDIETKKMQKLINVAGDLARTLTEGLAEAPQCSDFFSADNLSRLSRWAADKGVSLAIDDTRLVFRDDLGTLHVVEPLPPLRLPSLPNVELLSVVG